MNEDHSNERADESCADKRVKPNLVTAPLKPALQPLTTTRQNPRGSWGQRLVASYIQETPQYGRVMILFPGFDMVLRMDEQLESAKLERKCRLVSLATIAILGCCSLLHLQIADWFGARGMNLDGVLLVICTAILATGLTLRVIFRTELKSGTRLAFRLGMLQPPSSSAFFLLLCAVLFLTACLIFSLYALGSGLGFYTMQAYGSVYAWGVAGVLLLLAIITLGRILFTRNRP